LKGVADVLKQKLEVNTSFEIRHKDRNNGIVTMTVKGGNQIKKLYGFLYSDSTLFLNRKHEVFKKI
jgi:hypothetical protein